ncbi:hypothetical protein M422DRAFT_255081 [Sphaerobolus stellatus SS14]|uniref:DNA helicase Pif1-like 2B domain-containing protein n=1 Tax=Sphaerobolus stellatus (strain SS14) TaxID=990650 RepID=A0A0C9VTA9_SPHS4|nr:hypothetical protein M422DRAFT_255081 [Sphaerobolus stellatus SS14]
MLHLEQNPEKQQYAEWLLKVGHGTNSVDGKVHYLDSMKSEPNSVEGLINSVYPTIQVPGTATDNYLLDHTVLCPRNEEVNSINAKVTERFPGEVRTYLSADTVETPGDELSPYLIEFINSVNASSLPLHKLELKGCPIMLMWNLSPSEGLCNGTRLVVTWLDGHIIEACFSFLTETEIPFVLHRRRFSVHLTFATSINKLQGQYVKVTGIDLQTPVFTHGQLYVALSRRTSAARVNVLFSNDVSESPNIAFPEIL